MAIEPQFHHDVDIAAPLQTNHRAERIEHVVNEVSVEVEVAVVPRKKIIVQSDHMPGQR